MALKIMLKSMQDKSKKCFVKSIFLAKIYIWLAMQHYAPKVNATRYTNYNPP